MKYSSTTLVRSLTLTSTVFALGGCQHINVAQMTYEVLRADDCRRNQLEDFCSRTYASEYHDYEQLRQEFLRTQQASRLIQPRDELTLGQQFLDVR